VRIRTRFLCIVTILAVILGPGCQAPRIRQRPFRVHALPRAGLESLGPPPGVVIRPLLGTTSTDPPRPMTPEEAYARLRNEVEGPGGTAGAPERLLILADLADRIGRRELVHEPAAALLWFRDAAVYSSFYLADSSARRDAATAVVSTMQGRAIALHNHAVEELLRCAGSGPQRTNLAWREQLAAVGVQPASTTPERAPMEFDELWIASDFRVTDLEAVGWSGLGVPLIATKFMEGRPDLPVRFLSGSLRLPATAVLRPVGPLRAGQWRSQPAILALHDPVNEPTVAFGPGHPGIPLAADLTTPLAHQLIESPDFDLAIRGFFRPELLEGRGGIHLRAPYRPGQIPVLFVHGIWSSPGGWLPMVNSLQADPILRDRYQFWFAFYPSGAPIMVSTAMLRRSLHEIRAAIDPDRNDPALDQMVVVGHSSGGLLTRQLIQSSGEHLKHALFTRPPEQIAMSPESRLSLTRLLEFAPEPSIRRVVYIATPQRGSDRASQCLGNVTSPLIQRSDPFSWIHSEILSRNGPGVFHPFYSRLPPDSVENLRKDSPILSAMWQMPTQADVPYHSIIPNLFPDASPDRWNDGLVSYADAHLDGAESEIMIQHCHLAHRTPEASAEVRRILRRHLGAPIPEVAIATRAVRDAGDAVVP
jgi:pimeloyl-ACP methyl ester carboxylesterase